MNFGSDWDNRTGWRRWLRDGGWWTWQLVVVLALVLLTALAVTLPD
jgi:hypothetical protein